MTNEELIKQTEAEKWATPQKVSTVTLRNYYADGSSKILYTCPKCNAVIRGERRKSCQECGQALDWTEVTE